MFDPSRDGPDALLQDIAWTVNAIGITKPLIRDDRADEIERAIEVNARLPHQLAHAATRGESRVIQIATDCVYSGAKGGDRRPTRTMPSTSTGRPRASASISRGRSPPAVFDYRLGAQRLQVPDRVVSPAAEGRSMKGYVNHQWNGVTTLHFARLCKGIVAGGRYRGISFTCPTASVSKASAP